MFWGSGPVTSNPVEVWESESTKSLFLGGDFIDVDHNDDSLLLQVEFYMQ